MCFKNPSMVVYHRLVKLIRYVWSTSPQTSEVASLKGIVNQSQLKINNPSIIRDTKN